MALASLTPAVAAAQDRRPHQTTRELKHTPAAEQAVRTPVPVYVEYAGRAAVAKVALKYKGASMSEYKRVWLTRRGRGWGGLIPCGDVTLGAMRYYLQAFTEEEDQVTTAGSAAEPFSVPIRSKITGARPSLPGAAPPDACEETNEPPARETPKREEPTTETPTETPTETAPQATGAFARWWVGVAGSIDVVSMPGGTDVCKLTSQAVPANTAGYYCTNPDGSDFPRRQGSAENNSLANGAAGAAPGRLTARDVRVLATIDYALSASVLAGVRVGAVVNGYPGTQGRALPIPLHLELRATYLFGDAPLAQVGFAPYVFGGAGISTFDARTPITVSQTGIVGLKTVDAWRVAGPGFISFGGGARYAFSPRAGFFAGVRVAGAFGGGPLMLLVAPELSLQFGF